MLKCAQFKIMSFISWKKLIQTIQNTWICYFYVNSCKIFCCFVYNYSCSETDIKQAHICEIYIFFYYITSKNNLHSYLLSYCKEDVELHHYTFSTWVPKRNVNKTRQANCPLNLKTYLIESCRSLLHWHHWFERGKPFGQQKNNS